MMSRRPFLALAGATVIAPWSRSAFAQDDSDDPELDEILDQELAESLTEALPPGPVTEIGFVAATRRLQTVNKRDKLRVLLKKLQRSYRAKGDRISTWPKDDQSVDYRHLAALGAQGAFRRRAFRIDHRVLERLATANGYIGRVHRSPKVIFGLRGCRLAQPPGGHERRVKLVEARPNHFERRCVIGVWDRRRRTIAAFEGSTVPNRVQVELHWLWAEYERRGTPTGSPGLWMTNLLPQGLYEYEVGTHLDGAMPRARRQPGALRQVSVAPVLRARKSASYTFDEYWDYASEPVGDNIHASVYDDYFIKFSSQGCQTVAGHYRPRGFDPRGGWADFRRALDLLPIDKNTQTTGNDWERYPYLLSTGREARLHAGARRTPMNWTRVRFGSQGARALAVQQRLAREGLLNSRPDGDFGRDSTVALIEFQKKHGLPTDAVMTTELARRFNLPHWPS